MTNSDTVLVWTSPQMQRSVERAMYPGWTITYYMTTDESIVALLRRASSRYRGYDMAARLRSFSGIAVIEDPDSEYFDYVVRRAEQEAG